MSVSTILHGIVDVYVSHKNVQNVQERHTKSRLSFSGGPHAPVNMANSMEVNVGGNKRRKCHVCCAVLRYISYAKFHKSLKFFGTSITSGSRNSPTTGILHTIRHVYRSVWPAREAKPRFGAVLEHSAHDCETCLLVYFCPLDLEHCDIYHYKSL